MNIESDKHNNSLSDEEEEEILKMIKLGEHFYTNFQIHQSIDILNTCLLKLTIKRKRNDDVKYKKYELFCKHLLGMGYMNIGEIDTSEKLLMECFHGYSYFEDKVSELCEVINNIGVLYQTSGQPQIAIEWFLKGLEVCKVLKDVIGEGYLLDNIGKNYKDMGKVDEAMKYFKKSVMKHQEVENKEGLADVYCSMAIMYKNMGKPKKSLKYQNFSLKLQRKLGNRLGEAYSICNIGLLYRQEGNFQKSLEYQIDSLKIFKECKNKQGQAEVLNNIGLVYQNLGNYQESLKYQKESLNIQKKLKNKQGEAASLCNISIVYHDIGEVQKALEYQENAISLFKELENKKGLAISLKNMAIFNSDIGNHQKSLIYMKEALEIFKELGDKHSEAKMYNHIGLIYQEIGNIQQALAYLKSGKRGLKELGDKSGEASALLNIGMIYRECDEFDDAFKFQNQALDIYKKSFEKVGEASALMNISLLYKFTGNLQEAKKFQIEALDIYKDTGNKKGLADSLCNIGLIYHDMKNFQKALKYLNESLKVQKELGNVQGETDTLNNIGLLFYDQKDYQKSYDKYMIAVKIPIDMLLKFSPNESNYNSFIERIIIYINGVINSSLKLSNFIEVLCIIEGVKSLSYLKEDIKGENYKSILLDNKKREFCNFPKDVYCLHYYISEWNHIDNLIIFLTYNKKIVHYKSKEYKKNTVRNHISQLLDLLSSNKDDNENQNLNLPFLRKCSENLFNILIGDFIHHLPKYENIIIFPHYFINLVPFYCLINENNGRYFIEDYVFSIAKSFKGYNDKKKIFETTFTKPQKDNDNNKQSGLFLVDPVNIQESLLNNTKEVEDVLLLPLYDKEKSVILNKKKFTKTNFRNMLKDSVFDFIYFGTHFSPGKQTNDDYFNVSGAITFSNYELLYANEIEKLDFNKEHKIKFIFMNCCSTGRGNVLSHVVLGLSKIFFDKQIPCIISTLLTVDSHCAEYISFRFFYYYSKFCNENKKYNLSEYLRFAILDLIKEEYKKNDYFKKKFHDIDFYRRPDLWGIYQAVGYANNNTTSSCTSNIIKVRKKQLNKMKKEKNRKSSLYDCKVPFWSFVIIVISFFVMCSSIIFLRN